MASNTETLSFNFPDFTPATADKLILQGSAKILPFLPNGGVLALTDSEKPEQSVGRALYYAPVHIWDSSTGNVASFVTSFSFVIADIPNFNFNPADGIIFFLAPEGTQIPEGSYGGQLGVVNPNNAVNQFVGVEFDDWTNSWDPSYPHIGINANSLISLKTVKWNKVSGALVQVSIAYDSLTKTLSVVATNDNGDLTTVAQVIDLKAVLPEKVNVGFSAATSVGGNQKHDIYSWAFTSTLKTN